VFRVFAALNNLVGAIISLAVLAALGIGAWLVVRSYLGEKWEREAIQAELEASKRQVALLRLDLERAQTALKLLKVDHRVAQIDVLSQQGSEKNKDLVTTFSFVELDTGGKPLEKPRVFTVQGDVVYVDALVVKWEDESVETADPLRSASFYLFRRIFGEAQQPREGFVLDAAGSQPAAYRRGREPSEFEREIWTRFWEYANSREAAEKKGIRAAHGEAPFLKLLPGKRYTVELRASGGLSIKPEDAPAKPADKTL